MTKEEQIDFEKRFASLRPGSQLHIVHGGHTFLVMLTNEFGIHTGRSRYLVVCTTCEKLLHEATTGPNEQIEHHISSIVKATRP